MGYVKQTWVDNETPIDAEHMNHIEEGIASFKIETGEGENSIQQVGGYKRTLGRQSVTFGEGGKYKGNSEAVEDTFRTLSNLRKADQTLYVEYGGTTYEVRELLKEGQEPTYGYDRCAFLQPTPDENNKYHIHFYFNANQYVDLIFDDMWSHTGLNDGSVNFYSGSNNLLIGSVSSVEGNQNIVFGRDGTHNSHVGGAFNFAFNIKHSTIHGKYNDVSNVQYAAVYGAYNNIKDTHGSIIEGNNNNTENLYNSILVGHHLYGSGESKLITGYWNRNASDMLFIVGNGESGNRRNAFEVYTDGSCKVYGNLEVHGYTLEYSEYDVVTKGYLRNTTVNLKNGTGVGSILSSNTTNDEGQPYTPEELPIASGFESFAVGKKVKATGKRSFAYGNSNESSGNCAFTVGQLNTNSGNGALVSGRSNTNSGHYGFVTGQTNTNTGNNNIISGSNNEVSNSTNNSLIIGDYVVASGLNNSILMGRRLTASSFDGKAVFGYWNKNNSDAVFEIGNGTGTSGDTNQRRNAFEVYRDGRAHVGADPLYAMDVSTKQYVDNSKTSTELLIPIYNTLDGGDNGQSNKYYQSVMFISTPRLNVGTKADIEFDIYVDGTFDTYSKIYIVQDVWTAAGGENKNPIDITSQVITGASGWHHVVVSGLVKNFQALRIGTQYPVIDTSSYGDGIYILTQNKSAHAFKFANASYFISPEGTGSYLRVDSNGKWVLNNM